MLFGRNLLHDVVDSLDNVRRLWNPSMALGLLNLKSRLGQCLLPKRPNCGEVIGMTNKNDIINVSKCLNELILKVVLCEQDSELRKCSF